MSNLSNCVFRTRVRKNNLPLRVFKFASCVLYEYFMFKCSSCTWQRATSCPPGDGHPQCVDCWRSAVSLAGAASSTVWSAGLLSYTTRKQHEQRADWHVYFMFLSLHHFCLLQHCTCFSVSTQLTCSYIILKTELTVRSATTALGSSEKQQWTEVKSIAK